MDRSRKRSEREAETRPPNDDEEDDVDVDAEEEASDEMVAQLAELNAIVLTIDRMWVSFERHGRESEKTRDEGLTRVCVLCAAKCGCVAARDGEARQGRGTVRGADGASSRAFGSCRFNVESRLTRARRRKALEGNANAGAEAETAFGDGQARPTKRGRPRRPDAAKSSKARTEASELAEILHEEAYDDDDAL